MGATKQTILDQQDSNAGVLCRVMDAISNDSRAEATLSTKALDFLEDIERELDRCADNQAIDRERCTTFRLSPDQREFLNSIAEQVEV